MPNIQLLNEDCMLTMSRMKDKEFDLAICDPPYGIGDFTNHTASKKRGTTVSRFCGKTLWNKAIPPEKYFLELKRVSKERIIWGANYFNCFEGGNGAIVWNKNKHHPDMSICEIASYSRLAKVNYIFLEWNSLNRCEYTIHPCQKPVALYQWLLKNYAKQGDKILDTHLGSGSSAIAADIMGFDFVGIEIDEDYYKAALDRFNRHKQQLTLEI